MSTSIDVPMNPWAEAAGAEEFVFKASSVAGDVSSSCVRLERRLYARASSDLMQGDAEARTERFRALRDELHALALKNLHMSPASALEHLRALPPGALTTGITFTDPESALLRLMGAERMSASASRASVRRRQGPAFGSSRGEVSALLRFGRLAAAAYNADILRRMSAGNVPMEVSQDGRFSYDPESAEYRAFRIYDRRRAGQLETVAGTIAVTAGWRTDKLAVGDMLVDLAEQVALYRRVHREQDQSLFYMGVHRFRTLESLRSVAWYESMAPYVVVAAKWLGLLHAERHPDHLEQLLYTGYEVVSRSHLEGSLDDFIEHLAPRLNFQEYFPDAACPSAELVLRALTTPPQLWEARAGSVLRPFGTWAYLVDHLALSDLLSESISPALTRADQASNTKSNGEAIKAARAKDFEDALQALIDASPSAPPERLKRHRTVVRRPDGTALTDFDAIAVRGGAHLYLIDCKSYFRPGYHSGEHQAIRNTATELGKQLREWRKKVAEAGVPGTSASDDLAGYRRIVPVICTPSAALLDVATAEEEAAPGLRAICTASELLQHLGVMG